MVNNIGVVIGGDIDFIGANLIICLYQFSHLYYYTVVLKLSSVQQTSPYNEQLS